MQSAELDLLKRQVEILTRDLADTKDLLIIQIRRIWNLEQDVKNLQSQNSVQPDLGLKNEKSEEQVVSDKPIISVDSDIEKPIVKQEILREISSLSRMNEIKAIPSKVTPNEKTQTYNMDLEAKIGGNLFSKIGIFTLFLGIAFFLKYAFEHGWITEIMRVYIGILTGLTLLSFGEYFHNKNKYIPYARAMTGGGIAVLYLSFYATYGFYHLIDRSPALVLMVLTTITAVFFSIRYKTEINAIIGVVGANLTPVLLNTPQDRVFLYLSYSFILANGIFIIGYWQNWLTTSVLGTIGGYILPIYLFLDIHSANVNLYLLGYCALLTLISYIVSYRKDWWIISFLGVIGGYLTPLLLMPNYNYQSENFPYLSILALLGIALGYLRGWNPLIYSSFLLNALSVFVWGNQYYQRPLLEITQVWLVVFFLIYHIGTSLNSLTKKMKLTEWGIFIQLLIAASYFSPTYWMLKPDYPNLPGYIAVILVAFYLLNALIAHKMNRDDILLFWNQIGLASVFAALAIPILLDQQWITLGWAMEAVILTWIGLKGKNVYLRVGGLVLLAGVVVRLFFYDRIDIYYPHKDFIFLFNRRFLAFLFGIMASYGILYLIQKNKTIVDEFEKMQISLGLAILANILTLWIFSAEIVDFIDAKYGFWQLDSEKVNDLWMLKQMALSCLWAVYSILSVTIGMWKRQTFPRIFAIVLFAITILKVFLVDLSSLTGFPRILSFIVLGLILLLVSYMYQRFQEKLKEFLSQEIHRNTI